MLYIWKYYKGRSTVLPTEAETDLGFSTGPMTLATVVVGGRLKNPRTMPIAALISCTLRWSTTNNPFAFDETRRTLKSWVRPGTWTCVASHCVDFHEKAAKKVESASRCNQALASSNPPQKWQSTSRLRYKTPVFVLSNTRVVVQWKTTHFFSWQSSSQSDSGYERRVLPKSHLPGMIFHHPEPESKNKKPSIEQTGVLCIGEEC